MLMQGADAASFTLPSPLQRPLDLNVSQHVCFTTACCCACVAEGEAACSRAASAAAVADSELAAAPGSTSALHALALLSAMVEVELVASVPASALLTLALLSALEEAEPAAAARASALLAPALLTASRIVKAEPAALRHLHRSCIADAAATTPSSKVLA